MPPAARQGDTVDALDLHVVVPPPPATPAPMMLPFHGPLTSGLISDVLIEGLPAAVTDSGATNMPMHIPPGGTFQRPPDNRGRVVQGSTTVLFGGKGAARLGDPVKTCDESPSPSNGAVSSGSATVLVG